MAASDKYSLVVEAVTRGEQELQRFQDSVNRLNDSISRKREAMSKASAETGSYADQMSRAGDRLRTAFIAPLEAAGQALTDVGTRLGPVGIGAAAVVGAMAAAAAATFKLVSAQSDLAEALVNTADRTGMSLDAVDRISAAAKIAAVDIGSLEAGTRKVSALMTDFSTEGLRARDALTKIGVSFHDSTGAARSQGEVFEQLITRLGGVKDRTEQTRLVLDSLGRGGIQLLPLIRNFQELDREARNLGFGSRNELLKDLADANDRIDKLILRWDILKGKLAGKAIGLVEIVTKIVDAPTTQNIRIGKLGLDVRMDDDIRPKDLGAGGFARPGAPSNADLLKQASAIQEKVPRQAAADAFRAQFERTEAGQAARIARLREEQAKIQSSLLSPIDPASREKLTAEFNRIGAQLQALEGAKDAAKRMAQVAEIIAGIGVKGNPVQQALSNIDRTTAQLAELGATPEQIKQARAGLSVDAAELMLREAAPSLLRRQTAQAAALRPPNPLAGTFIADQLVDVGAKPAIDIIKAQVDDDERRRLAAKQRFLDIAREEADFEMRKLEMLSGPAGEIWALSQSLDVRMRQLEIQRAMGEEVDIEAEKRRMLHDFELRSIEIQQRRVEQFSGTVSNLIGAGLSGGASGLTGAFRSLGIGTISTIGGNLAREIAPSALRALSLPGQFGSNGEPTFLGRILTNTPFAGTPLIGSMDRLRASVDANTQAQLAGTLGVPGIGGLSGGGAIGTISQALGLPPLATGGQARNNPFVFNATEGVGGFIDPRSLPDLGTIPASGGRGFLNQYGRKAVTAGVYGVALAGGTLGVIAGAKQGGARGGLMAASSALGAAAVLDPEPVSKAVLAIAAAAAGLVGTLLPDPRVSRAREIGSMLDEASVIGQPAPESYSLDTRGLQVDQSYTGRIRSGGGGVTINVSTMDARSFLENRELIGGAVQAAMKRNGGWMRESMRLETARNGGDF